MNDNRLLVARVFNPCPSIETRVESLCCGKNALAVPQKARRIFSVFLRALRAFVLSVYHMSYGNRLDYFAMASPTFLIVTPCLNSADFLPGAIESVLNQDHPAVEYLVMDAASTDGTLDILRSFGGRLRWVSEPDGGQSDAINKGFARGGGEILGWLNSDDRFAHNQVISRVAAQFAADKALDIVYGDGEMVDAAGKPFRAVRSRRIDRPQQILTHPASFVLQPAVFFRRRLFEAAGRLRTDLHFSMDYDLWLRIFPLARKVEYLSEILARATYHPQAKSIRHLLRQVREFQLVKRQRRPDFSLSAADHLRLRAGIASLYAYWLAVRLGLRRAT